MLRNRAASPAPTTRPGHIGNEPRRLTRSPLRPPASHLAEAATSRITRRDEALPGARGPTIDLGHRHLITSATGT